MFKTTVSTQHWLASSWVSSHVDIPDVMMLNSVVVYKALGEVELKSMENQVSTVLMKMMFSHSPLCEPGQQCAVCLRGIR